MSAEPAGGERRLADSNLFVYAHDASAGRKGEIARDLIVGLWGHGRVA